MSDESSVKWKNKYYNSLDTLESMEKDWAKMSSLVSRAIVRITAATEGLDPKLDVHLKDVRIVASTGSLDNTIAERMDALSNALLKAKGPMSSTVNLTDDPEEESSFAISKSSSVPDGNQEQLGLFKRLLDRVPPPPGQEKKIKLLRSKLSDQNPKTRALAIKEILLIFSAQQSPESNENAQPQPAGGDAGRGSLLKRIFKSVAEEENNASSTANAISNSKQSPDVREVLLQLIDGLSLPNQFSIRVNEIKQEISSPEALDKWILILSGIIELILQIQEQAVQEKSELQEFLAQVTERLQELDANLADEIDDQQSLIAESEKLNSSVNDQVNDIQTSVNEATDLAELKNCISKRLDHIRSHMDNFRQFGNQRMSKAEARIQEMNKKLRSLESETKDLKNKIIKEHQQAMVDALTGVPNRLAYNEQMKKEYARWKRYKEPLSIIVWDIDFFKKVNDTYGHQAGDNALKFIADLLAKRIRETDFLARFGGEEFVILLPQTSAKEAEIMANTIRESIQKASFHFAGKRVSITVSGGISDFAKGDKPEDAFSRADKALYVCKENGRNCVTIGQ